MHGAAERGGNVSFSIYMYVTWFDSPTDGTGGSDAADGNGDGESDANGQDGKRVVVVVVWTDPVTGETQLQRTMSLFSDGMCPTTEPGRGNHGDSLQHAADRHLPVVERQRPLVHLHGECDRQRRHRHADRLEDLRQRTDLLSTYTNQGATLAYQFQDDGMYFVVNNVADNNGATADNDSLDCSVTASTTTNNAAGNGGPYGTVSVAAGAAYTTTTLVNLTLYSATAAKMQFSSDGSTWTSKTAYATSSLFTLTPETARRPCTRGTGRTGVRTLGDRHDHPRRDRPRGADQPAKDATYTCTTSGADKICKLKWVAPSPLAADLAGYRVYVRNTNSTTWAQQACNADRRR